MIHNFIVLWLETRTHLPMLNWPKYSCQFPTNKSLETENQHLLRVVLSWHYPQSSQGSSPPPYFRHTSGKVRCWIGNTFTGLMFHCHSHCKGWLEKNTKAFQFMSMILTSPLCKMNHILYLQEPKESCLPLHPVALFATPTFLALGGNFPIVRSWNHGNSRIRNLSRWYATKSENMRHALLSWYSIWSIIFVNFPGESAYKK